MEGSPLSFINSMVSPASWERPQMLVSKRGPRQPLNLQPSSPNFELDGSLPWLPWGVGQLSVSCLGLNLAIKAPFPSPFWCRWWVFCASDEQTQFGGYIAIPSTWFAGCSVRNLHSPVLCLEWEWVAKHYTNERQIWSICEVGYQAFYVFISPTSSL